MKKFYFEPEMNISTFSEQDVVTTSGVKGELSNVGAYNTADNTAKVEKAYSTLGFTFDQ